MEINKARPLERSPSILPPKVRKNAELKIMENYTGVALTRIYANNKSFEPVERVDVYMSGRDSSILGTDFRGSNEDSPFFSSVRGETPYTIKTLVSQGEGRYSSGELTIEKTGFLDIDIYKTMIVMNHYADREKTTLIASEVLSPAVSHPSVGNHPLV